MISCVCLTIPGRTEFLKRAIDCFRRQTYEDRELVIVADGVEEVDAILDAIEDRPIWQFVVSGKAAVGTKRNLGCQYSQGDTIALWDDDDYSAPHRLIEQYALLEASGKAVTVNYRLYMNDGDPTLPPNAAPHWWLSDAGWIDTSLMFKRSWWQDHQFQNEMLTQDSLFMHEANRFGQLHVHTGGERWLFATNHAGNTCERAEMYPVSRALKNFVWTDK